MCSVIKQLILIDQVSKLLSLVLVKGTITILSGFCDLTLVRNPGISLGFLSNLNETQSLALRIVITLVLAGIIIYVTFNKDQIDRSLSSSIELIAAGGISNLIDRFVYNGVIDFISLSFFGAHLFVCNLADIYITLGAIMLLLRFRRPPKQPGFKNILFKEDNL